MCFDKTRYDVISPLTPKRELVILIAEIHKLTYALSCLNM